jgi:hypothetical protein
MGRFLKNRELRSGSYSIRLPMGSSAVGPDSPVSGLIRYNITLDRFEYYAIDRWRQLAQGDALGAVKDTFYGDGVLRTFGPMLVSYDIGNEIQILVFVGGVFQNPGDAFTVDADMITFTSTPPDQHPIIVLHGYANI